jgi:hypothetical protein
MMKRTAQAVVIGVSAFLIVSLAALAGSYTVHLCDGRALETRYPPRYSDNDVQFLTKAGEWITVPHEGVTLISNNTEVGRQVRRIDSKTVLIGWAPNDAPVQAPEAKAQDAATVLLSYLKATDSVPVQDFSVRQFVATEEIAGGLPHGIYLYGQSEPLHVVPELRKPLVRLAVIQAIQNVPEALEPDRRE